MAQPLNFEIMGPDGFIYRGRANIEFSITWHTDLEEDTSYHEWEVTLKGNKPLLLSLPEGRANEGS